jgi:hypothetical protein
LPGTDGLTPFQRNTVTALQSEFAGIVFSSAGDEDRYLRGALPGADAVFFIYKDGAQFQVRTTQFRAEHWDYESPSTLVAKLVLHGREALRSNISFKADGSAAA